MSLTAAEVAEIMRLVEQSTFDELTLEMNGVKLTLKRGAAVQVNGAALPPTGAWTAGAPMAGGVGGSGAAGASVGSGAVVSAAGGNLSAAPGANPSTAAGANPSTAPAAKPFTAAGAPPAARPGATIGTAAGPAATYAVGTNAPISDTAPRDANSHDVPSPLLGTFYRSPKPGAPPFIEIGAKVEEDTVIAIVEVMKLMNTVRAGTRGTVTDIFVQDGALVEFDQPLIRVRKSA